MLNLIKRLFSQITSIKPLNVGLDSGERSQPTVVMLHGLGATYRTWDGLVNELDNGNYRLIAIDLLGFGDSPMPVDCEYDVQSHVKYLRKTIKKLKIKKPFKIVGHSMGSIIAANYCYQYPDDIQQAYLLSLPIYSKNDNRSKISDKLTDLYIKAYQLISTKKDFTIKYSKHFRNILRIKDGLIVDEKTWHSFSLSLQNTIVRQHVYHDIKNTKLPFHIIFGSLDEFLIQENVYKLEKFDNVTITKLVGINHTIGKRYAKNVASIIGKTK